MQCIPTDCIKACQEMGVKVLLTLECRSGKNPNSNNSLPYLLRKILLDGPFDGINLLARDSRSGYLEMMREISQIHFGPTMKKPIISVTVQCTFPDGYAGPVHHGSILEDGHDIVDMLIVQMYGSGGACHYAHRDAFWKSIELWKGWINRKGTSSKRMTMAVGLPSQPHLPGDFVPKENFDTLQRQLELSIINLIVFSNGDPAYFQPSSEKSISSKMKSLANNREPFEHLIIYLLLCTLLLIYTFKNLY